MAPNTPPSALSASAPIKLNEQQTAAVSAIETFLQSSDPIFILNGPAGTGKTTLVHSICKNLTDRKTRFELAATTGRAAKVLSAKTGFKATTLHSLLYAFDEISGNANEGEDPWDSATGQLYLNFGLRTVPEAYHSEVYIVDEASMISHLPSGEGHTARFGSGVLLNDLLQFAGGSKIIFVGDACQLPPIADASLSAALSPPYWQQRGIACAAYTLTTIVRQQQDNEILQTATVFRAQIESKVPGKLLSMPLPREKNVFATLGKDAFLEAFYQTIQQHGAEQSVLVSYGNNEAHILNNLVRHKLGMGAQLQPGDLLMVVQNSYSTALVNGDQVTVRAVQPYTQRAGFTFLKVSVQSVFDSTEVETLLIADLLYNNQPGLSSDEVKRLLIDFDSRMRHAGVKRNSPDYKEKMMNDEYLNALRAKFGYAITVHKAQGGEWNAVFLYLDKTIYSQVYSRKEAGKRHVDGADKYHRWFYTAITRAKEKLVVNDCPMVKNFAYRHPDANKEYWKNLQQAKEAAKAKLATAPAGVMQGEVCDILNSNEKGVNGFIKSKSVRGKIYFILGAKNPLYHKLRLHSQVRFELLPPKEDKGPKATRIQVL